MIMVEKVVVIPTDAGSGVIRDKRKTPDNPVVVPINPPIEDTVSYTHLTLPTKRIV